MCTTEEEQACPLYPDASTVISAEKLGLNDPTDLEAITDLFRNEMKNNGGPRNALLLITSQDPIIVVMPNIHSDWEKDLKFGTLYPKMVGQMRRFFMEESGGKYDIKSVVLLTEGTVTMVANPEDKEAEMDEGQDVILISAVNAKETKLRVLDKDDLNEILPDSEERCFLLEPIEEVLGETIRVATGPSIYS